MPRLRFHRVLERVRVGMVTVMSRPLKALVETVSARSTILPRVALSRSRSLQGGGAFGLMWFFFFCHGGYSCDGLEKSAAGVV
jgi:hypothetical protein